MEYEVKNEEIDNSGDYSNEEKSSKKRKTDFYVELVLFFILGILLGIALKTEALKRITMGFNDYKMKIMKQDYNINNLQTDILKKSMEDAKQQEAAPEGIPEESGNTEVPQDNNTSNQQ